MAAAPSPRRGKDATNESACQLADGALLLAAAPALVRADVINFSGLSTDNFQNNPEAPIPNGYAGFNWSNFSSLNTLNDPNATPSGYSFANTDSASPSVGFNLFGNPASISRATDFSFYGAFFTAAWRDGLQIDVTGYRDGQLVYQKMFTVNSTGPTFEAFDFLNIDTLDFSSSGGTDHHWVPGAPQSHPPGTQFAIDDLIFIPSASGVSPDGGGLVAGGGSTPPRSRPASSCSSPGGRSWASAPGGGADSPPLDGAAVAQASAWATAAALPRLLLLRAISPSPPVHRALL